MNYEKHYQNLIVRAQTRELSEDTYKEIHHVIPRQMGGQDDSQNLVALLPEEHLVAHLLLCKMYPSNHKLVFAANMMTNLKRGIASNNKQYGWVKRKFSETQRGKIQVDSEETKKKKSETWKRKIAEGCPSNVKGHKWTAERRAKSREYWDSVQNMPKPQKQYKTKEEISKNVSKATTKYFSEHDHHTKETDWYTNGTESIRLQKTDDIPEGYRQGRTFLKPRKRNKPTMTVYTSDGQPFISVYSSHVKSLSKLGLPSALCDTAEQNSTLYDESYCKQALTLATKRGYIRYKGWYARWNL